MVRENFVAGLQAYANGVATENPDGFKAEIEKSHLAGMPITTHDNDMLKDAYAKMVAEQVEAELRAKENCKPPVKPITPEPPAKPKAKATRPPKSPKTPTPPTENKFEPPTANGNHAKPTHGPDKEPALVS